MPAENILLLPGMMCDERLWQPQLASFGQAVFHADTTTTDNFADMAAQALAAAPDRFAIAGLSMGGILAFEIWRQAPQRVTHMALDLGPEVFRAQSLALRDRRDSVATLATIDCPTVVLCGDEDTLCPVGYHKLMAGKIPNARLRIIENCGHLSSLEQPDIVTEELNRLFAQ